MVLLTGVLISNTVKSKNLRHLEESAHALFQLFNWI